MSDWTNLNQSLNLDGLCDEASFDDEIMESQVEVEDDPQRVLHDLENQIEELRNHGMDRIIDKEGPM